MGSKLFCRNFINIVILGININKLIGNNIDRVTADLQPLVFVNFIWWLRSFWNGVSKRPCSFCSNQPRSLSTVHTLQAMMPIRPPRSISECLVSKLLNAATQGRLLQDHLIVLAWQIEISKFKTTLSILGNLTWWRCHPNLITSINLNCKSFPKRHTS